MPCARAARLIPLSVSGDLTRRQARFVAAHAEVCESCRQLVAEYRASRNWLQGASQVEFGEEFYAGIRSAVLSRITAQRPRRVPPPAFFFLRPSGRPFAFAASVALLCLFAALAYQLADRRHAGQINNGVARGEQKPTPVPSLQPESLPRNADIKKQHPPLHDPLSERRGRGQLARHPGRAMSPKHAAPRPQPSQLDDRAQMPTSVPQRTHDQAAASRTLAVAMAPEEVSRIEIQTADPNIRIIWLTPKAVDSSDSKNVENR